MTGEPENHTDHDQIEHRDATALTHTPKHDIEFAGEIKGFRLRATGLYALFAGLLVTITVFCEWGDPARLNQIIAILGGVCGGSLATAMMYGHLRAAREDLSRANKEIDHKATENAKLLGELLQSPMRLEARESNPKKPVKKKP